MKLIIIDFKGDIYCEKKKYPHPMKLIAETDELFLVENQGSEEKILKSEIKNSHIINYIKD